MKPPTPRRADRIGNFKTQYLKNRRRVLSASNVCAICGRPVDKELKAPDPMSPTVDHIIPIAKGGHPSDIDNLQLAHWICNRLKSDKLYAESHIEKKKFYQTRDWTSF